MYIRIGDPNSSDFTAIDFKVGIVTRDSLDEKSWNKWIEFLKENQSPFEAGMFLNMGQILSIPLILLGVYFIFRKPKKEIIIR